MPWPLTPGISTPGISIDWSFRLSSGAPLAGWGVPGLADDPQLEPLFQWRDRIGAEVGRP